MVEDYQVLNAAHYDRWRLFLLGARTGRSLPEYPQQTHTPSKNGNSKQGNLSLKHTPTVWEALRDLPEADDYEALLDRDWVRARFKMPTAYSAPLRRHEPDPEDYSASREFDSTILTSSLRTVHTELSKKRFSETKPGDTEPVSRFHKLDREFPGSVRDAK